MAAMYDKIDAQLSFKQSEEWAYFVEKLLLPIGVYTDSIR